MATDRDRGTARGMDLHNDTAINVVGLLKEPIGATRVYPVHLDAFELDEDLLGEDVRGEVKLTRLRNAVMATVRVRGGVALECARCLRTYGQGFDAEFTEEYRQTVDVRTGVGLIHELGEPTDDEVSTIDETHELDLADVLRQEILVALPMRPDCGEACPGPHTLESGEAAAVDDRLSALARLLDEDEPVASGQ